MIAKELHVQIFMASWTIRFTKTILLPLSILLDLFYKVCFRCLSPKQKLHSQEFGFYNYDFVNVISQLLMQVAQTLLYY
jgi:hypothetical protein